MNYLLFTLFLFVFFYFFSFMHKKNIEYSFFDKDHTTIIKGIAIICVVLSHITGKFGIRYLTPLGGIGVAMFLICSGYGLTESYNKTDLKFYWSKKIKIILVPYFILQTIVALVIFVTTRNFSISNYIQDILLISPNHPLAWYLQFLFIWYIIFFIVNTSSLNQKNKLLLFNLISLLTLLLPNDMWAEQSFSFTLGIEISYYLRRNLNKDLLKNNLLFYFYMLVIGIFFLAIKQYDIIRDLPFIYVNLIQLLIKLPIATGLILLIFHFKRIFSSALFYYAGIFSFEIYLIHGYTLKLLETNSYLNIILFILSTALAVVFFTKLIQLNNYYNIKNTIKNAS